MSSKNVKKEAKIIGGVAFTIGIILLVTGITFNLTGMNPVSINKALIALSLIPLSVALVYFARFSKTINSDRAIQRRRVRETDERLVASRNEIDAQAFKVVQASLFISYMGYTLFVPEAVFQSVAWWILLGLLMISFFARGVLYKRSCGNLEA